MKVTIITEDYETTAVLDVEETATVRTGGKHGALLGNLAMTETDLQSICSRSYPSRRRYNSWYVLLSA